MLLVLAALNDGATAAIAVVGLLLGVVFIVRGPRSEQAVPAADRAASGPAVLKLPIAPAATAEDSGAKATTFRHGTIKLGADVSAPSRAAAESPVPPASPARFVPPAPAPPAAFAPPAPMPPAAGAPTPEPPPPAPPAPIAEEPPQTSPPPPTPAPPAWRKLAEQAPRPAPDEEAASTPGSQAPFKHGSIRFRK